jgi:hypothetical protein
VAVEASPRRDYTAFFVRAPRTVAHFFPQGELLEVGVAGCTKLLMVKPLRWRSLPPLSSLDCWFISLGTARTTYLTRLTVHCYTWPQNPTLTYFGSPSPQKRIPAGVGRRVMYSIINANHGLNEPGTDARRSIFSLTASHQAENSRSEVLSSPQRTMQGPRSVAIDVIAKQFY